MLGSMAGLPLYASLGIDILLPNARRVRGARAEHMAALVHKHVSFKDAG